AVAGVPTQPSKRIESGRFRGHSPNGIEDEKEEQVEQEEEEEKCKVYFQYQERDWESSWES
ncbi:hypothetical protein PV327_000148, partial [Microctonus hyperodae]